MWHTKNDEFMVGPAFRIPGGEPVEIVVTGLERHRTVFTTLLDFAKDKINPFPLCQ
jgi:hypothetical protein